MTDVRFQRYVRRHRRGCLGLFDRNCPEFFALAERDEYRAFLDEIPGDYRVGIMGGAVVSAYGLAAGAAGRIRVRWILVDPSLHGSGIGRSMLAECVADARR